MCDGIDDIVSIYSNRILSLFAFLVIPSLPTSPPPLLLTQELHKLSCNICVWIISWIEPGYAECTSRRESMWVCRLYALHSLHNISECTIYGSRFQWAQGHNFGSLTSPPPLPPTWCHSIELETWRMESMLFYKVFDRFYRTEQRRKWAYIQNQNGWFMQQFTGNASTFFFTAG